MRAFGPARLDLAESAAQEALEKALRTWPTSGTPDRPEAWLFTVARNHALDLVGHEGRVEEKREDVRRHVDQPSVASEATFVGEVTDDELRMLFLCCDPEVPRAAQVAVTLNIVGGFSAEEISRAFFLQSDAVYQRIHRAKKRMRSSREDFGVPDPRALPDRLDAVLDVVYLTFNEGYTPRDGDAVLRVGVTDEATRLAMLLAGHTVTGVPRAHALSALLLLQSSRMAARLDSTGALVPLADQDRSLWEAERIDRGLEALARASTGDRLSEYHLLAGIAACHATAPSYEQTDWTRIVSLYDHLADVKKSFVVDVNRAIAVAELRGAEAGLALLDAIDDDRARQFHLLAAARGELLSRLGRRDEARAAFQRASSLAPSEAEKKCFERRACD